MSQHNVEIVRRAFAYEIYGVGGRAEAEAIFHPDVVMNPTDAGPFHGSGAMRDDYERWASEFEELEVSAEEFIDGGDRVLVTARHRGRGRLSGVEAEGRFYEVYTLRDGKVIRVDEYVERAQALEAVGLRGSENNVEVVRRWMDQFASATTPEAVSAIVSEFWDPDADYYPVQKFPDRQPRHGSESIAEFMGTWRDAWGVLEFRVGEIVPIDDVRVLAISSINAQGHETQAVVDGDLYFAIWMRNGRLLRVEDHLTEAGARRALGLAGA